MAKKNGYKIWGKYVKEAEILRALASEPRLIILELLEGSKKNEKLRLSQKEISERLVLKEASTAKHLKKLLDVGLLEREKDGHFKKYSIVDEETLSDVFWYIAGFMDMFNEMKAKPQK